MRVSGGEAQISWQNSSCLPGFEVLVAREDSCDASCLDNNQTDKVLVTSPGASLELDVVYYSWHQGGHQGGLTVSSLVQCEDYVVMVRLITETGLTGPVTSQVFRPGTNSEAVTTFSHHKWLPPVSSLRVVAGVSEARLQWVQPDCMSEYEVLVVETGEQCGDSYQCLQSRHHNLTRASQVEQGAVSLTWDSLASCTQYRVIVRSKGRTSNSHKSQYNSLSPHQGGTKFGAVSEVLFWTLPSLGSPFSLASFTVRSGANQLELRWRHQHVVCTGSYIVKTCTQGPARLCKTHIVNTENKRFV